LSNARCNSKIRRPGLARSGYATTSRVISTRKTCGAMADDLFEQPDDATPLRPEEAAALRAPVVDRRHLNEIEAGNVEAGRVWAMRSRKDCLADDYPCDL